MTTTISSREFNQHSSDAKRRAASGPVLITDRGKPTHVLLTYEDYRRLAAPSRSIADLLAGPMVCGEEFDAELERARAGPAAPGRVETLD